MTDSSPRPKWELFKAHLTGFSRVKRLPQQLFRKSPFSGDITPSRVPLIRFGGDRPTFPFPHPWNYRTPIKILETYFHGAEELTGSARHNRYLDVLGLNPIFVTRDPGVIRAISTQTGAGACQFDRDTLPSAGIARATGKDSLLYANGACWKRQKKLAMPPFARTTLFQPEQFQSFEHTFRGTINKRLAVLRDRIASSDHGAENAIRVELEPEIQAIMLEMLVNNFFGARVSYDEIRKKYVPGLVRMIDFIVRDTVMNKVGVPLGYRPTLTRKTAELKRAKLLFEELTDHVLSVREHGSGMWEQFKSDAPDDALRSNIRVFLAGALEATTSYASWAISHLARHQEAQRQVYEELRSIQEYTPEVLERSKYFQYVLDETLRLTPSLYFHPRRSRSDTSVVTSAGQTLRIPRGTHILLDIWHANRHEDHWGVAVSGYPAIDFEPLRWKVIEERDEESERMLHFGFGHGPRFCPGKSLGQLEVALVVGAFVKLFEFTAVHQENPGKAGVSTKPRDGVLLDLRLRTNSNQNPQHPS